MAKLQKVQNFAGQIILGLRKYDTFRMGVTPPPTLPAGLAFCRALRITTEMANQTPSITNFNSLLGLPPPVLLTVQIVSPLIELC